MIQCPDDTHVHIYTCMGYLQRFILYIPINYNVTLFPKTSVPEVNSIYVIQHQIQILNEASPMALLEQEKNGSGNVIYANNVQLTNQVSGLKIYD